MNDITLPVAEGYFICRVGAIIIDDDKLLMVKNDSVDYYYTVGGRIQFSETTEAAVVREVYEETNIRMLVERLAFIHENFFNESFLDEGLVEKPFHELAFYYLMKPPNRLNEILCRSYSISGEPERLHWLPIAELGNYKLYPEFLKTQLPLRDDTPRHFITNQGS